MLATISLGWYLGARGYCCGLNYEISLSTNRILARLLLAGRSLELRRSLLI